MTPYRRIPPLANPDILIRRALDGEEISRANLLVFRNYVAEGYWDDDAELLTRNPWLHSAQRDVYVAVHGDEIIGTVSIIRDSEAGLPSDSFQPQWLRQFRSSGEQLAEVSALAIDRNHRLSKNLMFYMMNCYMQHSFYYTPVTRLIKACRPKHANFYADVLRFEKIGDVVHNNYARTSAQLLSINLFDAHRLLNDHYAGEREERNNFYRFLLVDQHPNIRFPEPAFAHRARRHDWVAYSRLRRPSIGYNWRAAAAERPHAAAVVQA